MDEAAVRTKVREVVLAMAPVQPQRIDGATLLAGELGYDSLGLVQVAATLEDEFGLTDAGDEGVIDVETVADVEERMLGLLGPAATARGA